jgi:3-hydroxy-9,10-secoandrosta-1,3,5(10)-triene-9,17-dione monooxygenase
MKAHPVDGQLRGVSALQLRARAQALGPGFSARRAEADERRNLSQRTIEEIQDAQLFDVLRPAGFGGLEMDLRDFFDIQNDIAEHCLSTAWVYGVLTVQAFMLARFDPRAQADVWDGGRRALISSSFRPGGQARRVEGGYRLSGDKWTFSSGSAFCGWALLGAMIAPDPQHAQPEMRVFLVPAESYSIVDTWSTFGLRGTGSNDIHVKAAFVPAHRTWRPEMGFSLAPGAGHADQSIYRIPWTYAFGGSIANLAIGAGRGAIRQFKSAPRALGMPMLNAPSTADPAPPAVARAHADIEAADLLIKSHVGAMMAHLAAGGEMSDDEGLRYRTHMTGLVRRVTAHIDRLMLLLGGRGISVDGALTRTWLDLCAARHHPGNNPDSAVQLLGDHLLSLNRSPA